MKSATRGTLSLGGASWSLTGHPAAKTLRRGTGGSVVNLRIRTRSRLDGTVEGDAVELTRAVLRPIPAAEDCRDAADL